MINDLWKTIEEYYQDLLVKPDPKIMGIVDSLGKAGLPQLWISASLGRFLELLTRSLGARRVLEIGTQGGYSTAWLGRGLPEDGLLVSLEINPKNAELARHNLADFDFTGQIQIQVGDALDLMEKMRINGIDPFDLIFIDAEKSHYSQYLEAAIQLSRPGTVVIADNVVKHGHFVNQTIETPRQVGITEFHHQVANDPRLQATVLQTVDSKGHDGFSFIIVDPEV